MKKKTIACIYDFDGTLSPHSMQDFTILEKIGITSQQFWKHVNKESVAENSDSMLTYMRLILSYAKKKNILLSRKDFFSMGQKIDYYKGVEEWFPSLNDHIKKITKNRITLQHYIISSGLQEILEGITIRKYFEKIYASSYYFDEEGYPVFPNNLVNASEKIRYLFRINKGQENIDDYVPEEKRPIPFSQMIYIGDGITDVPSMSLLKKNGGFCIAVYNPNNKEHLIQSKKLFKEKRVDLMACADYRTTKQLRQDFCFLLNKIIESIS